MGLMFGIEHTGLTYYAVWQKTITEPFFESSIETLQLALSVSYFYMFGQIGYILVFYAQN